MDEGVAMRLMIEAFACNARIAAMQAANAERQHKGLAQAYGEESFDREASTLQFLAGQFAP